MRIVFKCENVDQKIDKQLLYMKVYIWPGENKGFSSFPQQVLEDWVWKERRKRTREKRGLQLWTGEIECGVVAVNFARVKFCKQINKQRLEKFDTKSLTQSKNN